MGSTVAKGLQQSLVLGVAELGRNVGPSRGWVGKILFGVVHIHRASSWWKN